MRKVILTYKNIVLLKSRVDEKRAHIYALIKSFNNVSKVENDANISAIVKIR